MCVFLNDYNCSIFLIYYYNIILLMLLLLVDAKFFKRCDMMYDIISGCIELGFCFNIQGLKGYVERRVCGTQPSAFP